MLVDTQNYISVDDHVHQLSLDSELISHTHEDIAHIMQGLSGVTILMSRVARLLMTAILMFSLLMGKKSFHRLIVRQTTI